MTTNTKISTVVSNQLPEFVRSDHPTFVSFLEAYYEYLEQSNNTLSYGKTVERAKNLRNYFDIDKIDQTQLTEFSEKLYDQFLTFIPQESKADRSKLLKNIKDFYLGGGTQRSYDFIYRILFGEESSFYYPKDDILKASSGKWYIEKSVRLTDIRVNGVSDDTVESLKKFTSTLIRGNNSTATAQVEKILTTYEGGVRFSEFFLSKQKGTFIAGEPFFAVNVNGDTISGNLLSGFISTITITDGGSGYTVGTPIVFEGGQGGVGATAFISNVSLGNVSGTIVLQGGSGFKGSSNGVTSGLGANPVLYTGGAGLGASGYVDAISANGGFHPTYYRLCVDTIDEYDDVVIGQYSNTSTLGDANTPLTNTWSYVDYGPIGPAVSIEVNEGGSGYTSIPLASIVGNTTLRSLSVPGKLSIVDPGVGYSNGDTIVFANKTGVYGYGANAYVNVDANGAITSYTWRTIQDDEATSANALGARTEHIGGLAYSQLSLPDIKVQSTSGGVNAVIAIESFLGFGETLTSTTGTIGQIIGITITNKGYGYLVAPTINLVSSGDGTATAYANAEAGTFTYPGKYLDDTGLISGTNKLEDRDYYQNYSYVVKLRKALNTYRKYIDDLVHPTGTKLWAEFEYKSNTDIDDEVTVTESILANYSAHSANSYYFANSNSIIYKNSPLNDTSNSNTGAISLWFNPNNLTNDQMLFAISNANNYTTSPRFSVVLTSRGTSSLFSNSVIRIEARDASNVLLLKMESNVSNKITPNTWIRLLSTWDLNNVTNNRIFLSNINSTNVRSPWVPTSNSYAVGGYISGIDILSGGQGYNANAAISFTEFGGANATYTIANSINLSQSYSTNSRQNTIASITINNRGFGYNASNLPIATAGSSNIVPASFAVTMGDGYLRQISITSGGQGYNSNGFLIITGGGGSGANASYFIANSLNSNQTFSSNALQNTIFTVTINNPGSGYTSLPTITAQGSNITIATFSTNVVSGIENTPTGIFFRPDGTSMFIVGHDRANISQYNLSTPWNVSTAKFVYATANIELSYVTDIVITDSGSGYNSNGVLVFSESAGSGTVATYTAKGNGRFTGIHIGIPPAASGTSPGKGYSNGFLTITESGNGTGANIAFTVNPVSGAIVAINVRSAGHSYDPISPPRILPPPQNLANVEINVEGTGYSNGGYLVFEGGNGTGANATYEVGALGNINKIIFANTGSGYTSRPNITAQGANTSAASFTAVGIAQLTAELSSNAVDNVIHSITVTSKGSGYNTRPLVTASGSNISRAIFVATMEGPNPGDIYIKNDGTRIYTIDETLSKVMEYNVVDAWNLKSISVSSSALVELSNVYVSDRATNTHGLHFSTTGNSMYVTCSANAKIYQYTLSTNWSVNTASYTSNLYIGNIETSPQSIMFDNTGIRMYVTGFSSKGVSEYRLETPWNITTARHYITHTTDNEDTQPKGAFISRGNNKIFVVGDQTSNVREYLVTEQGVIDYTAGNISVSGTVSGNSKFVGCISELWFSNNYLDHTNTALMNKFNSANGNLLPTNLMVYINPEWSYTGNSFNVRAYEEDPRGIFFKPDGTSMYTVGFVNANISKYNLSTPWDVNTAIFIVNTANVGICDTGSVNPNDIFIKSDGTRLYIIYNRESKVKQFDMSQAWNVLSISVAAGGFLSNTGEVNVAIQESNTSGLHFSNNGTYMYVTGTGTDKVHQYTLSESWNVSTASYTQNVNVFAQTAETQPTGLAFNENGTKMFITGSTQDSIYEFNLTTPWDVLSSSYIKRHSEYIQDTAMTGLYYDSSNGAFVIGSAKDTVFKYNVQSEIYTTIYLKGNTSQANINYGRGGNFNYANSIVTCNTSPSDT